MFVLKWFGKWVAKWSPLLGGGAAAASSPSAFGRAFDEASDMFGYATMAACVFAVLLLLAFRVVDARERQRAAADDVALRALRAARVAQLHAEPVTT